MERIGSHQLYVGIIMFVLGSAPLYELGVEAKQNAPLAMLVGALAGLLLVGMYLYLYHRAPEAGLTELYRLHFGLWIGSGIAFVHGMELAFEATHLLREYGYLTTLTLLESAPGWLMMLIACLLAGYTVIKGVEVLFRVIEILFPLTLTSYIMLAVMLYLNKLPDLHRLLPFVGFGSIIRAALPTIMVFPFGQIIVFLAIWNYVREKQRVTRMTLAGYLTVTAMLTYGNAMIMAVLGPQLAKGSSIPLLQVVQLIELGGFIERLDIIVTLLLFFGLYVKLAIGFMAVVLIVQPLFKWNRTVCAWVIGTLLFTIALLERNYTTHVWLGRYFMNNYVLIFQLGIPAVMLLIGLRRGKTPMPAIDSEMIIK
ncbi:spore germination protein KB [Paenibacillus cellulosilyticus]|uniref:Spore germination protein KB n=1 Tax=Paenibacillus cellulosilyticus TaxID=375489 RepID=A0A2V2YWR5_9BACL|nr:GerAB/ArcD/ProY family transporter [Paenibacillus cellulosilyticus]PWW06258.1 spore germination protein KB [Paenibacillus cellulosilyticus]QKS42990.1 GerAB/ArcD/ProY family transporter [Paenibacillus cellulosilyticus]